jgi:adenylate kinase
VSCVVTIRAERATDISEEKASKRYNIFKRHYTAILRLKQFFPFHLIDAMGSIEETRAQMGRELRYQVSTCSAGSMHMVLCTW